MSLSLPKCDFCKHYYDDEKYTKMCCEAFPKGIPLDVMGKPREEECANGIKFERETEHPS